MWQVNLTDEGEAPTAQVVGQLQADEVSAATQLGLTVAEVLRPGGQ